MHHSQLSHSYTLQSLEPKPLRPFKSCSAYLEAMKEDLAEWLNRLYSDLDLTQENFFSQLETGAIICRHANNVTQMGRSFMLEQQQQQQIPTNDSLTSNDSSNSDSPIEQQQQRGNKINKFYSSTTDFYDQQRATTSPNGCTTKGTNTTTLAKGPAPFPTTTMLSIHSDNARRCSTPKTDRTTTINWFRVKTIPFKQDARPGTFFARDNICQFILWCRSLNVLECLLFETDDLVGRKNEKSFILCLLEVARIGFKVGMPTPLIIQLEQEIDREIENDAKLQKQLEQEEEEEQLNQATNNITIEDNNHHHLHAGHEDGYDPNENGNGSSATATIMTIRRFEDTEEKESLLDDGKTTHQDTVGGKVVDDDNKEDSYDEEEFGPKPQVITNDLLSLHEKVSEFSRCCHTTPLAKRLLRVIIFKV